ncbi:MAG: NAD(+)/NADH kinase [Bacteroidetes bacterium]|nr:NAD(+)/NADH kinase [Bacteroidota bacterium]
MSKTIQPRLTFGLFGNIGKPLALDAVRNTIEFLRKSGVDYLVETEVAEILINEVGPPLTTASRDKIARDAGVVIVFGGDGTMLASMQHTLAQDTPLLGVNLGKLGFLTDVNVDQVEWAIGEILAARFRVERRMTLAGRKIDDNHHYNALNDIVLAKSGSAKVISIDAHVNGEFLASFHADGIIISTPTGSTAYSLATGGPVVVPSSNVIVISPISAHTLTARPVIVNGDNTITVRAHSDEGAVMAMVDGVAVLPDQHCMEMEISRGVHDIALVKNLGPNYFETLRTKLNWARDSRFEAETSGPVGK